MKKWQFTFQKIVNKDIYDIKYWQGNVINVTEKEKDFGFLLRSVGETKN